MRSSGIAAPLVPSGSSSKGQAYTCVKKFSEQDLEDLPADEGLKAQIECELAECLARGLS